MSALKPMAGTAPAALTLNWALMLLSSTLASTRPEAVFVPQPGPDTDTARAAAERAVAPPPGNVVPD